MKTEQSGNNFQLYSPRRNFRRIVEFVIILICIVIIVFLLINMVQAQVPPGPDRTPQPKAQTKPDKTNPDDAKTTNQDKLNKPDDDQQKEPKRGSWIIAPIPINSPAFGAGVIIGVGYVFKLKMEDNLSPPSTVGAATAFTNNGSRGIVAAGKLYFDENKYQTTIAVGKGKANYDFYGIGRIPGTAGIAVEINQSGQFIFGEFMRNFGKNIFIGPRYQYRKLTVHLGGEPTPGGFEIPQIDLVSKTAALGFHVQRDVRDHTFYPRKGSLLDFKADFFAKAFGSNRNYQAYSLSYNGYHSISKKQVLAYRAAACSVSDNAPFFDLCLYGAKSDIRGYTAGEFQNRRMFATQAEFRQELPWRLGVVGFAGIGGVARRVDEFRLDKLMPGAGVGLRFKLDKTNHINYRIDLGFGRSGHTLTFSVTEAF